MAEGNGIIGDNYGMDLPLSQVDEDSLNDEKKMAKFTKTAEFKRMKQYAEGRIKFYQDFLPNGKEVDALVTPSDWALANTVIREFNMLLGAYDNANEVVRNAEQGR